MNLGNFKSNDYIDRREGYCALLEDNYPIIANEMPIIKIPAV